MLSFSLDARLVDYIANFPTAIANEYKVHSWLTETLPERLYATNRKQIFALLSFNRTNFFSVIFNFVYFVPELLNIFFDVSLRSEERNDSKGIFDRDFRSQIKFP